MNIITKNKIAELNNKDVSFVSGGAAKVCICIPSYIAKHVDTSPKCALDCCSDKDNTNWVHVTGIFTDGVGSLPATNGTCDNFFYAVKKGTGFSSACVQAGLPAEAILAISNSSVPN